MFTVATLPTHAQDRSPRLTKARHGMAWFARVSLCPIICVSFSRQFTPKSELNVPVKLFVHVRVGQGISMDE